MELFPTWDLAGNAFFRRFSGFYVDGNFEQCSQDSSFPSALCFRDDRFSRAAGQSQFAYRRLTTS